MTIRIYSAFVCQGLVVIESNEKGERKRENAKGGDSGTKGPITEKPREIV